MRNNVSCQKQKNAQTTILQSFVDTISPTPEHSACPLPRNLDGDIADCDLPYSSTVTQLQHDVVLKRHVALAISRYRRVSSNEICPRPWRRNSSFEKGRGPRLATGDARDGIGGCEVATETRAQILMPIVDRIDDSAGAAGRVQQGEQEVAGHSGAGRKPQDTVMDLWSGLTAVVTVPGAHPLPS